MKPDESYEVVTHDKFEKHLKKNLPSDLRKVFDRKVEYLSDNPNHPSLNTKAYNVSKAKLNELEVDEVWEFYINKSYRCVFYLVHEQKIMILAYVGDHNEVKRKYA